MTPALIKRVESARGPDREIDAAIAVATNEPNQNYMTYQHPYYTSSLDAAVSLCERVLPGWHIEIRGDHRFWHVQIGSLDQDKPGRADGRGRSPALALVLAVLRAVG